VTLDEERRVTGVYSGEMEAAHLAGIAGADAQTKVPVRPVDIVLTSSAGYPLDTTFYQCVKGIVCALPALNPGGTLIIATGLTEGVGGEEFTRMCHELRSAAEFIDRIYNSPVEIDQWQLQEFVTALQKAGEIMIVSDGLGPETLGKFLLSPYPTVEAALEAARSRHGRDADIVVIPEGPYVTPVPVA
jgi:nickel-dependent lactate racemase